MDEKTWLEERKKCITGTDIGAIIGVSKWGSPLSVYCDKLGISENKFDNKYMEWGKRLERIVAEKFSEETGRSLIQGVFTRAGIFGGTPDFIADGRILEIKTTSYYNTSDWGEQGTDQIPPYYLTQVQWYLGLLDLEFADVAVLIGGNDYRTYEVKRNEKLINVLRERANHFWKNHVLVGDPPAAKSAVDNNLLGDIYKMSNQEIVEREDLVDLARKMAKLKTLKSKLETKIDDLSSVLKYEIKEASGVKGHGWSATWKKTKNGSSIDWQAIAEELGASRDLISKHTKPTEGYRRFVFRSSF